MQETKKKKKQRKQEKTSEVEFGEMFQRQHGEPESEIIGRSLSLYLEKWMIVKRTKRRVEDWIGIERGDRLSDPLTNLLRHCDDAEQNGEWIASNRNFFFFPSTFIYTFFSPEKKKKSNQIKFIKINIKKKLCL